MPQVRRAKGERTVMGFDTVVFSQRELERAVKSGCTSAALCDGSFVLPEIPGVHYSVIGNADVSVPFTRRRAAELNITFELFEPEFAAEHGEETDNGDAETVPEGASVPMRVVSASFNERQNGGSFGGSFASSYFSPYITSFALGSYSFGSFFAGSYFYMYEYEFEFGRGSFGGSFAGSYRGSFGSFASSCGAVYEAYRDPYAHIINPFVLVNGYGMNLI